MNHRIASRETLLSRALREGFEGARAVPPEALEKAAWIAAEDVFGLVARTRPEEGLAPRDFPALYSADSQVVLRFFGDLAPSPYSVPLFFEGRHPTTNGARAGMLVLGGSYPESFKNWRFPAAAYDFIPPGTVELLMVFALEESGGEAPVTEARAIWFVPVGEDGRALGHARDSEGTLLMVTDRRAGPFLAHMAHNAYSPLLECALLSLGCLNAVTGFEESTLTVLSPPADAPGGGPYAGGGYALEAGEIVAALEGRGRAAEDGLENALRRCGDLFELPEEDAYQ